MNIANHYHLQMEEIHCLINGMNVENLLIFGRHSLFFFNNHILRLDLLLMHRAERPASSKSLLIFVAENSIKSFNNPSVKIP